MFRNVLVAVDGSADSEEALTQAIDLAESEHTRLTLITGSTRAPAISYFGMSADTAAEFDARARSDAAATLRRACDRVPEDIPVTTILTEKPIRPALIEQLKHGDHDLIVMGSRGRGTLRSVLLGSVSHYVLHHSPIPVLIVRATTKRSGEDLPQGRRAHEPPVAGVA